jgi:phage shock protein C
MLEASHRQVFKGKEVIMNSAHDTFRRQGLVRPREGRVLGGVCAGLGRRFGIDPWPARLLFVLVLLVIPGSQILIYPILWILMPGEVEATSGVPDMASAPDSPGPTGLTRASA